MSHPNAFMDVCCSECGTSIRRRPLHPKTKLPICKFFCDIHCKAMHQRRARPVSTDDLRRMYIDQGMSAPEIASVCGRHPKRVWQWLIDDGIPTRPRGHDESLRFQAGHKIGIGRIQSEQTRAKIRQARVNDGSKGLFKPNGDHVLKGRRGKDHPSWRGGGTPERQAFYASDEWKAACRDVWHRADARCDRCGLNHRLVNRAQMAFHVHHVASFSLYPSLRSDPANLNLLCAPCHRWVHSRANTESLFLHSES